jgi:hypothetical protein
MSMPRLLLLAALALSAACYTSPEPAVYAPALSANGVHGVLRLRSGADAVGELLEVREDSYVLLIKDRVTIVPYATIASGTFEHQDWMSFGSVALPNAETRQRLRWDSRFPFGMRDTALAALLRASKQTEPDVARGANQ